MKRERIEIRRVLMPFSWQPNRCKMLRMNIARLVRQRGKQLPQVYLMTHGFTRDEARSILNPRLRMVRFSIMTRLCELFDVYPNELFAYDGSGRSHLNGLNEVEELRTDDMLEGLAPEQIAELVRLAEGMRKGK